MRRIGDPHVVSVVKCSNRLLRKYFSSSSGATLPHLLLTWLEGRELLSATTRKTKCLVAFRGAINPGLSVSLPRHAKCSTELRFVTHLSPGSVSPHLTDQLLFFISAILISKLSIIIDVLKSLLYPVASSGSI